MTDESGRRHLQYFPAVGVENVCLEAYVQSDVKCASELFCFSEVPFRMHFKDELKNKTKQEEREIQQWDSNCKS